MLTTLKATADVAAASNTVLLKFEQPADQGETAKQRRAQYAQGYYDQYAARQKPKKEGERPVGYTNSPLVSYTRISPNRTSHRTHEIDTIHPYAVTPQAYTALLDLVTDICKRNGIQKLLWKGDKGLVGQVDKHKLPQSLMI